MCGGLPSQIDLVRSIRHEFRQGRRARHRHRQRERLKLVAGECGRGVNPSCAERTGSPSRHFRRRQRDWVAPDVVGSAGSVGSTGGR